MTVRVIVIFVIDCDVIANFTRRPSNPTYVKNGTTAKLVWDYSDPNNDLIAIVLSVLVGGSQGKVFKRMLFKQDGVVYYHTEIPPAYKERVRMEGKATLVIQKITPKDSTEFSCEVLRHMVSPWRSTIQLIVAEPPKISLSSVQGGYREGSFVNISCTASGIPEPDVTWTREGTVISSRKGAAFLIFNSVRRTDDGLYLCRANNTAGSITNQTTLVLYQFQNDTTVSRFHLLSVEKPSPPSTISSEKGTQTSSLTVRCAAPADDGGSPITGYRVIILEGDTEINSVNITVPGVTSYTFGGLERDTNYVVKVFARNAVFEGNPVVITMKTKSQGSGGKKRGNRPASKRFSIDEKRVREWRAKKSNIEDLLGSTKGKQRSRLSGGGRKPLSAKVEELLLEWIENRRARGLRVSCKLIMKKAEVTYMTENNLVDNDDFKASRGWLENFIKRNGLSLRRKTSVPQQDPDRILAKLVSCVIQVRRLQEKHKYKPSDIGAMDETPVWCDMLSETAVDATGKKSITLKSTGYEKARVSVCPAAKADGTKLKPMVEDIEFEDLELSDPDSNDFTQRPAEYMDLKESSTDGSQTQISDQVADYAPLHPSTRSWEVSRDHVTIEKIVGKGAFGQVAKGTAKKLRGRPRTTKIAIKMLNDDASESDKRDLINELYTMKQLKPHPHVIRLLGCVTEFGALLVLIEYVPFGDLLGYLRKSRGLNDTYFDDPDIKPQTNLTSQQLMKFSWQIADGMSYLSSKSIIHRDLAARNVLVGENETCKVTDFGMARDVKQENIYERKTKSRMSVKWTAYEALLYGTDTTKSDVYQIMMRCWQNDPDDRPTFTEMRNQLKDMETLHKRLINMKMYDKQLYANVDDLNV
ncbi:Proto-oncogene tyrosine-protein kinase receptor Ret [Stylophora pistillata]|uniref:receptor protein-tyrosine kinase n=1 Tax=Stylophora pistillata TaxID=50429 RepID=A0A2B4S6A0_STYPI|nr:Proto-oncogene tyrosine-protein kinase receptor Ret [Stylophora pistillata]